MLDGDGRKRETGINDKEAVHQGDRHTTKSHGRGRSNRGGRGEKKNTKEAYMSFVFLKVFHLPLLLSKTHQPSAHFHMRQMTDATVRDININPKHRQTKM